MKNFFNSIKSALFCRHEQNPQKICPVCGKYYFKESSYEICPVCGWEDDPVQRKNPELAGGANKLSLTDAIRKYKGE